ncbi:hypothetical protein ACFPOE_17150 [Caenimonas terrae]|uniref:Uncharacterized protein n=1 Tax=Caenimonas terrae TaxID=696074 RepID=A0ABW0NF52_9BURK
MATSTPHVRERGFADFSAAPPETAGGHRRWLAGAHNFWLEWIEFGEGGTAPTFESDFETILLAPRGALHLSPADAAVHATDILPHCACIVPAGRYAVIGDAGAACVLIASQRGDIGGRRVLGAQSAATGADPRVLPTGRPYRRTVSAGQIRVMDIDAIMASRDKPRLKMLQTETLSINIVEYRGARDRAALSPHAHSEFEQGSLAITGEFVHHLRVPWSGDAGQWRDDEHLTAHSPSLLVVPVEMIHTTEGVGDGHHFLVDVFSPPRRDFIDKGWVFNSADYAGVGAD